MAQQEVKRLIDLIEETIQIPTVLIRSIGPYQSDSDTRQNVFNLYKNILPDEVYVAFIQDEFITVSFDTIEEAVEFCEDHFPIKGQECPPEQYVQVWAYNENGEIIYSN